MAAVLGDLPVIAERVAPLLAAAVFAASALTALVLWRLRPREAAFAGLALFAAAAAIGAMLSDVQGERTGLSIMLPILGLAGWTALTRNGPVARLGAAAATIVAVLVISALAVMNGAGLGPVILLAGTVLAASSIAVPVLAGDRPGTLIASGTAIALLAALYDAASPFWNSVATLPLLPFAGLLTLATFGLATARRLLAQFEEAETLNATLEDRISAASAGLAASEAARRALEISTAITRERERLMREIHDGIGSSLVTTIAVSERLQKETTSAVVLKRALTDLRIAVDSLEPVQGNAATLLASLRYRVEPDFRKAGISFVWKVDAVPSIPWLDAVNALHVLRIFQEALGNIAIHSGATEVTVICRAEDQGGIPGVLIEVRDNGKGLTAAPEARGHGLDNMEQRARALGGRYAIAGEAGKGTSVSLWLPLKRAEDW